MEESSTTEATNKVEEGTRRSPIFLLILGTLFAVALMIGIQVFTVLYAIIFPPLPPLPDDSIEVSHENIDYGVDTWLYSSSQDACDILLFYHQQDVECRIAPSVCASGQFETQSSVSSLSHVAECTGEVPFSIFAMRWNVNIAGGYASETAPTQFNLSRQVFWTGAIPPQMNPSGRIPVSN